MIGKFDVILTGTEKTVSKDGKNVYLYANLLQKSELKRCRIESEKMFDELLKLGELKPIQAEIEVSENNWDGKVYINYKLLNYSMKNVSGNSGK